MKKQYFGDIRDLFKYDLLQAILEEISPLQRLTFIPMLTRNEDENDTKSEHGNKRAFDKAKKAGRPGTNNEKLIGVLKKYGEIDKDKRDFTKIVEYFHSENIEPLIYKGDEYFDKMRREEYFKNIPGEYLHNPLIFVDPDTGLQVKNSKEEHLLYQEVKDHLYDRMDKGSILMIYQQFPREYHPEYLSRRTNELKEQTKNLPIYISDNEIVFFLLTKNDELKSRLEGIISRYERNYPKRITTGNVNYNGT